MNFASPLNCGLLASTSGSGKFRRISADGRRACDFARGIELKATRRMRKEILNGVVKTGLKSPRNLSPVQAQSMNSRNGLKPPTVVDISSENHIN